MSAPPRRVCRDRIEDFKLGGLGKWWRERFENGSERLPADWDMYEPGAPAGAIWSLSESTADDGKAVLGVIAATHQWVGAAILAKPVK